MLGELLDAVQPHIPAPRASALQHVQRGAEDLPYLRGQRVAEQVGHHTDPGLREHAAAGAR
ncbi:hypothetical protein [Actinomadura physcomitrii]|uniref:hypothetical protein n=1 Tax=Actinomadura physcomitrii TaxID=2650748 RepID=UPI001924381A|nr:hypothetical protein [Actinomadura physcomitrii]